MATPAMTSPGEGASDAGGHAGETQDSGSFAGDPALDAGSGGSGDAGGGPAGAGGPEGAGGTPESRQAALFRFAQRQWPSQERAEREFLTTIGRLQAEQRRVSELTEMVEALKASRGAPQGAEQGETGADGADGDEDAPLVDIDSLDWQLISTAMQEKGPEVGMYLFAKALTEAITGGFQQRMGKALEPLGSLREHTMQSVQTARLWQGAQEAVGQDGNMLFPELSDPQVAPVVFDIWRQITDGLPPEVANSPRMARTAVLEYRMLTQGQTGGGAVAGNGAGDGGVDPQTVAAGAVDAMRAGARSTGILPAAPGQTGVRQQRPRPQTEEEQIRQSLLTEGQERSPLGFRR